MTDSPQTQTSGAGRAAYDTVVIGGGPAGLAGAVTLARSLRSVLVVDTGEPRNAPADGVHALLGNECIPPAELLARGRAEATSYGATVVRGEVVGAAQAPCGEGFTVTIADREPVDARRILLATGLVDELPDIPGLRERWGHDVLHCPYCHGWEVQGRRIGVLASGPMSVHQAQLFRQLSDDVTFLTNDTPVDDDQRAALAARRIHVLPGKVMAIESLGGKLAGARLAGGTLVPVEALVVAPRMVVRAGALAALGLEVVDHPMGVGTYVPADATGRTNIPGVWAAGNVTDLSLQVIGAAAAGTFAGAQINADLVADDVRVAVAAGHVGVERSASRTSGRRRSMRLAR